MRDQALSSSRRRGLSLTARVSLLLVLVAIVPLLITIVVSQFVSRPALTAQARTSLDTDSSERVQLISNYLNERLLDAETLVQVPSVIQFLLAPPAERQDPNFSVHSLYALQAGINRDNRYTLWCLFDAQGHLVQYWPTNVRPQNRGQSLVPLPYLQRVNANQLFISGVYYDSAHDKASVDIYAPITYQKHVIGFLRASLNIDFIWNTVNSETGANGPGSYAFLLDERGVRIADPDPTRRFKGVAPLSAQEMQEIKTEGLYGLQSNQGSLPLLADSTLADSLRSSQTSSSFEATPASENEPYEILRHKMTVVPWTYYVLSPVSTVTAVVNNQMVSTIVIAAAMLLLAAFVGLWLGQRITQPILRSVDHLRRSSESLQTLAAKQQSSSSEQQWVIDSAQVGLQSVQYYTDASNVAARQLTSMVTELLQRWPQLDGRTAQRALQEMANTARYIEQAIQYQETSNQKLATAIKVTTQVSEQLAAGATSATSAAEQLEQVVRQLRRVVGR
ncbi:cache domain-containing protein [Thermogemmatispora sp.]|uniref:cache domain-containing protein n=1 Tax=Thermogemmatispora sp. TaxID=1968838 RepID=UPI0035E41DA3